MLFFNENLLFGTLSFLLTQQKAIVIGFIVVMRLFHCRGFGTYAFILRF